MFNKKSRLKFYYVLTILLALSLLLGCVFVLTGSNIFAFAFSIGFPILAFLNMVFLLCWSLKKSKFLLVPLFSLIVFFLCFNSFLQFNFKKEKPTEDSISVLTYNVRSFNKRNFIDRDDVGRGLIDFVIQKDADIVCFQEFSLSKSRAFDNYPFKFLARRINVNKSMQVLLSKFPIINSGYIDFPNTYNNAMFADIEYKDGIVRIYNVHLQSFWIESDGGKTPTSRRSELFKIISMAQKMRIDQTQMILDHAKDFDGPIMICGDFNSTQFSSTYKALKKGRKDSFVEAGLGLGTTYSLFSYPLRLDYVLVDNDFDVVSHQNFNINLSDHEPVLVELVKN